MRVSMMNLTIFKYAVAKDQENLAMLLHPIKVAIIYWSQLLKNLRTQVACMLNNSGDMTVEPLTPPPF